MTGISLFAGGGIPELCFENILPDYRTIAYVEIDEYCRAIIRARIRDGVLRDAPIFDDIREFNSRYASLYAGKVDWVSAGFPCQPFSVAGNQLGEADERNLWPATRDAISILRPRYVFLENVPGLSAPQKFFVKCIEKIRQLGLFSTSNQKQRAGRLVRHLLKIIGACYTSRVLGDLAEIGYDCEWDIVGAEDVGACHKRKRLWILAYPQSIRHRKGREQRYLHKENGRSDGQSSSISASASSQPKNVAYPVNERVCRESRNVDEAKRKNQERPKISRQFGKVIGDNCNVPDTSIERSQGVGPGGEQESRSLEGQGLSDRCGGAYKEGRAVEPRICRVVDGLAYRTHRLKAIGNGWDGGMVKRILRVTQGSSND